MCTGAWQIGGQMFERQLATLNGNFGLAFLAATLTVKVTDMSQGIQNFAACDGGVHGDIRSS
ncbi:hypothetical protein ACP_3226 [Acidobacterium capsulatum ATCC 51196]|uniref:Uncharacterized protein n=1 Tax=Acidobacterium capsulatum (strain ATCC 51196 / DSM 11244 / BCRC 80197 / JCM 7670 / NBRC 15755 / NCIMB 13165 / 161) TaxID=240015 RepID=C1F5P6_ACIC5|nr:hypothetical protein ACP_3226 [Acidobacterium capsulatum ATCC 51196]